MSAIATFLFTPKRSVLRWPLAAAATAAAAAHIPVISPHLDEAPYMGVLFALLTAACLALAVAAVIWDTPAVYAASVMTCSLAVIGYAATRLVAFPLLADDVGNWFEPLGLIAVCSELVVVALGSTALRRTTPTRRTPDHRAPATRRESR